MTVVTGALEALGFEEVEPGIVADSSENRRRIRSFEGHWSYEHVRDEDGVPTGLIRVLDPNEMTRRRDAVGERRSAIMVDPEDKWSDYVGPDDYPLDADVPYFINERLAKWKRAARDGIPPEDRLPFPARCTTIRHDETRCWNWASNPKKLDRCKYHAGWVEEAQLKNAQYAKVRMLESAPRMAENLEFLALNAEGEAVRLKATTEILDRVGVRAGMDISVEATVEVTDPANEVRARLDKLGARVVKAAELEQAKKDRAEAERTVIGEIVE